MDISVLLADDDPVFRELVCDIIKKEGYNVIEAQDGQEALDVFFSAKKIDLVVLDVMMPRLDGWEVLKELRAYSNVPVLMLTALGDEHHEVLGLVKGADEYVAKPFSYLVFTARMNALLRQVKKECAQPLCIGKISVDPRENSVIIDGEPVVFNPKEYALLVYLMQNSNHILSRDQILTHIWGYAFDGDVRTIDTHVKMIRAKLRACEDYIVTVRGIGYMLKAVDL